MIILIDGPSGAGKSALAERTAHAWGAQGIPVVVVHMDDIYPGWHGLRAGADHARDHILAPYSRGEAAAWRGWDWNADAPAEWTRIPPNRTLILEGCGALARGSDVYADLRVWLDADDVIRKERAIARDGELFARWWEVWQSQYEQYVAEDDPRSRSDMILDGTASGSDRVILPHPALA